MRRTIALSLLLGGSAAAAPRDALHQAERRQIIDAQAGAEAVLHARAAAAAEQALAETRVQSALRLRASETAVADATAQIDALTARRGAAEARLHATAESLTPLLPVIERLSRYPAETLLAVPLAPDDAVRGLIVIRGLAASMQQRASQVRTEQQEVARLQADIDAALPGLRAATQAQQAQSAELDAQLAQAHAAHTRADDASEDASRRAAASAGQAETLRQMLAQIDSDRRAAEARAQADTVQATRQRREADAAAARQRHAELAQPAGPGVAENQLTVPVVGTLVHGWGEQTDAGTANGVSYQATAGGRVVSPCGGRVVFGGPFRSFGVLAIVDCGGGFHTVLAGFDRLDVAVGRTILAGEPLGVMPAGRPLLYVELRHDGQPVNPAPFLKARPIPS